MHEAPGQEALQALLAPAPALLLEKYFSLSEELAFQLPSLPGRKRGGSRKEGGGGKRSREEGGWPGSSMEEGRGRSRDHGEGGNMRELSPEIREMLASGPDPRAPLDAVSAARPGQMARPGQVASSRPSLASANLVEMYPGWGVRGTVEKYLTPSMGLIATLNGNYKKQQSVLFHVNQVMIYLLNNEVQNNTVLTTRCGLGTVSARASSWRLSPWPSWPWHCLLARRFLSTPGESLKKGRVSPCKPVPCGRPGSRQRATRCPACSRT